MRPVEVTVLRDGRVEGRAVLGVGAFVIGRTGGADILLPDPGISRRHATLFIQDGSLMVEDNGSGNGTFYRNKRVQKQVLGDGDEIHVPPFVLSFHLSPEPSSEVTWARPGTSATTLPVPISGARLVGIGRMAGKEYPLILDRPLVMGRASSCDIELADPVASREHAEVFWQDGAWVVRDRNSSNGTSVNGQRIRERPLKDGDRIRIGLLELQFCGEDLPDSGGYRPPPKARPAAKGLANPLNQLLLLMLLSAVFCASGVVLWQIISFAQSFYVAAPAGAELPAPTPAPASAPTPSEAAPSSPTPLVKARSNPTPVSAPPSYTPPPYTPPPSTPPPATTPKASSDSSAAEAAWVAAQKAIQQGDYVAARNQLKEALRQDPNHQAAAATLPGVEKKLRGDAEAAYKEGRRLEDIDDSTGAARQYRKVMSLVGDRNDDLYKRAEARLMGLGG
jgi:pSer/pThr/pTyr-binding forkhead associated (FHA) protein/outer membrane biosynthesis protein TonB